MAVISVTIPDAKIPLLKAAIAFHTGAEELTTAEAAAWVKARWISQLHALVAKYQEAELMNTFVPDEFGT